MRPFGRFVTEDLQLITMKLKIFLSDVVTVLTLLNYIALLKASEDDDLDSHEEPFPPEHYNKMEPAGHGKFQFVNLSLSIESIVHVDTAAMEFVVYSYIIQEWRDPRLKRKSHELILQEASEIWKPDIYCLNCRESTLDSIKNRFLIRISQDGKVYYSQSALLYVSCMFDFRRFPFDVQKCPIHLSSYSYNTSFIAYRWHRKVTMKNQKTEQYAVNGDVKLFSRNEQYIGGNFKIVWAEFELTREIGFYIGRLYLPSAMLVCLSWIAFYISPSEIGDRIALGITLLLSMIFLMGYVDSSLPKVSYVKAVDYYMIVALVMIILSVVETVVVYYCNEQTKEKENSLSSKLGKQDTVYDELRSVETEQEFHENNNSHIVYLSYNGTNTSKSNLSPLRKRSVRKEGTITEMLKERSTYAGNRTKNNKCRRIENFVRIVLPLFYFIFNVAYYLDHLDR